MSTTVNVPTCDYTEYKLIPPYDSDLQTQFNNQLNTDFTNRDDSNACAVCQQNMANIGYSSDLYNCSSCLGFSNNSTYSGSYPKLSKTWGCDTCAAVVAPVSYYESVQNNQSSVQLAGADKLQQYIDDLTYQGSVNTLWSSLSSCEQGTVIKSICINSSIPSFSMNVPPANYGPSNPYSSSTSLSAGAIAGIVIGCVVFVLICGYFFWRWWKSRNQVVDQKYPDAVVENPQPQAEEGDDEKGVVYQRNPAFNSQRISSQPTPILGRHARRHLHKSRH